MPIMNEKALKQLAGISSAEGLRTAVRKLCLPYGDVSRIDLFPLPDDEGYMLFVELVSPTLHPTMINELGGVDFGNSVAFRIPFKQPPN